MGKHFQSWDVVSKLLNTILLRKMVKHFFEHVFRFERCCAAFILQTNKVRDMLNPLCGVGVTIKVNVNRGFAWLLRYVLDLSTTIFDIKVIHFLSVDFLTPKLPYQGVRRIF